MEIINIFKISTKSRICCHQIWRVMLLLNNFNYQHILKTLLKYSSKANICRLSYCVSVLLVVITSRKTL